MSNEMNNHTTFLRTQSYLVNGKVNPLSNISRKKYFSNYLNICSKKKNNTSKRNSSKDKKYINQIKNLKKKKQFYSCQFNKKHIKKFNIKENKKEIENYQDSEYSLNYSQKQNEFENNKENKPLNNYCQEQQSFIKTEINEETNNNKFFDNKTDFNLYGSNRFIEKKNNHYKGDISLKIPRRNNYNDLDVSDLINKIHKKKQFSNSTKFNNFLKYTKPKNNIIMRNNNSTFTEKNRNIYKSFQKDNSYINKIFSLNVKDFTDINYNKNNNKLLYKLNYYKKRENFSKNNFKSENTTTDKLKLMKRLINKTSLYNTNNFYPKNNLYENNSFKNFSKISRNNNFSQLKSEYQINSEKNLFKANKDLFKSSLSNAIYSMRDERNTKQFIKELNKNKTNYNRINDGKLFSFNKQNTENWDDDFYSSLKNKLLF